jgi:hypothetical protein
MVNRRFSQMRTEFDGPRPFPAAPARVTVRVFDPASERNLGCRWLLRSAQECHLGAIASSGVLV